MAERHDILLGLNLDEFIKNLDTARKGIEALQGVATQVAQNIQKTFDGVNTSKLDFGKASTEVNQLNTNLKNFKSTLDSVAKSGAQATKNIRTGFGDQLGQDLQRGLEIGLSHAVGAISIGADPFRSLRGEITRNLSISLFNNILKSFKGLGDSAASAKPGLDAAAAGLQGVATEGRRAKDVVADLQNTGSAIGGFFKGIDVGVAAVSAGLILIGALLDRIGDRFLSFTQQIAEKAGAANLAFTQLDAILRATEQSIGGNLGPTEQWARFLTDLSVASGRSRKDLAEFSAAFVQVGASAGLTGEGLQQLVRIAAFTGDRFRNSTEQLTNFRQALAGNVRFLANNIPIGTSLAEVTDRYALALQRQGLSQEEATRQAKDASVAQKVLGALQESAQPIIDTAINSTGSYTIELRKLNAAFENLQISFGTGIEGLFARATRVLRVFVEGITALPQPIQTVITSFITLSGVAAEVGAVVLKLAGAIGLLTVAYQALNVALARTQFQSILGLFTNLLGRVILLPGPLTSLKDVFVALKVAMGSITGGGNLIRRTFQTILTGAGALAAGIGTLLKSFLTLGTLIGALKLGGLIALISLVTEAFKKLSAEGHIAELALAILNGTFGLAAESLSELAEVFGLTQRAAEAFSLIINVLASAIRGIAYGAGIVAEVFFRLTNNAEALGRVQKALTGMEKAQAKANAEMQRSLQIITASNEELMLLRREALDSADAIGDLGKALQENLSEEQLKILERGLRSLRGEVNNLRARQIELISGKAAGEQARALLRLKELVTQVDEQEGGAKLFAPGELDAINSADKIFDRIRTKNKDLADQLQKAFNQIPGLARSNEALERQKKLFTEIINSVNELEKNLNKEIKNLEASVALQNAFNDAISGSTNNFDELVEKAKLEQDIRKATLDIDARIADLRDRIQRGTTQVTATGQTVRVSLTPAERRVAEAELNKLTKDRTARINVAIDEAAVKRVGDIITEFQKRAESINKFFVDNTQGLRDQGALLEGFTEDLAKGTQFAEDNQKIREKDLELANKIKEEQEALLDITTILNDENNNLNDTQIAGLQSLQAQLQANLSRLQVQREYNVALTQENQLRQQQNDFLRFITRENESLQDQLSLIEERSRLFEQGILSGEFNRSQERVDALTNALENLIQKRIQLQREAESTGSFITEQQVNTTIDRIKQVEEALKAANFVNDIRELLQTIPDAVSEALTESVRGVLQGTQTITELFRNMAQNIALALSNIFAQRAVKAIGNGLDQIAETIAKSSIGRAIAEALGINVDAIFQQQQSPEEALKVEVKANTTATLLNTEAINRLIAAISGRGIPVAGQTGQGGIPVGGTPPFFPEGTEIPEIPFPDIQTSIDDWVGEFEQDLSSGFEAIRQSSSTSSEGFFSSFGNLLESGFESITNLFSGFDFGSLFSGFDLGGLFGGGGFNLGSLFGFNKGGFIGGTGSGKEDEFLAAVAPGEGIINSEATDFYGGKGFIDAINSMALPQDFFGGLQTAAAPAQLSNIAPSVPQVNQPAAPVANNQQPVNVTVIDKSPKLDPSKLGMQEDDVVQVYVNGIRKDRIIRRVTREDLATSRV